MKYVSGTGGFTQIAIQTTAQTLAVPTGATPAGFFIQAQGTNVRWRADGTAPDITQGMIIPSGAAPVYFAFDLGSIQFIGVAPAATIGVQWVQ